MHPRLRAAAPARQHRRGARAGPPPPPLRRDRRAPARVADGGRRPAARRRAPTSPPRVRSLHVELVLTAHPTEATRRSVLDHQLHVARLLDRLDDPRIGRSRRRALRRRAARGADDLVADRRGPPRAARWSRTRCAATCSSSRRRCTTRCPRCSRSSSAASRSASTGASCRSAPGPARTWTATRRSGPRRSRARSTLHRQAALRCCATRSTGSPSSFSHSSRRTPVSPALEASLERDAAEVPSARVLRRANRQFEPLRTKLGFITRRLHEHARPARARAGLRRPGGAARRPLARARERRLGARRARQPAPAAVAGRRVRLPHGEPRRAPVGVGRAGGGRARCCRATPDAREAERLRLLEEAITEQRRGLDAPPDRPGRRAAARARHGRARPRGVRQARRAGDGAVDGAGSRPTCSPRCG